MKWQIPDLRNCLAELLGTFTLVFAGTGAIIINDVSGGSISHVGIALTFGLVVMAMIYTLGDISGAHLNPAVSFGFCIAGRFPRHLLSPYIVSQCLGALLASAMLRLLFPRHSTLGATLPTGSAIQSLTLEIILTFLLMFVMALLHKYSARQTFSGGGLCFTRHSYPACLGGSCDS